MWNEVITNPVGSSNVKVFEYFNKVPDLENLTNL